jgi:hypothetical protein
MQQAIRRYDTWRRIMMANYMGQRIIDGVYTYDYVISKRPDLKSGIDAYLTENGRGDLIKS